MKITFKRNDKLPYGDLNIGDIFTYNGLVYMVTDQPEEDSTTENEFKSVDLASGEMETFGSKVIVTSIGDAELILH